MRDSSLRKDSRLLSSQRKRYGECPLVALMKRRLPTWAAFGGGTARNVVPNQTVLEGEARSRDNAKLARLVESLRAAIDGAAKDCRATVEREFVREYSAYYLSGGDPSIELARRVAERLGLAPRVVAMGGGSDANSLNERGLPSVVLGLGMQSPHSVEEVIAIDDMARSTEYVVALIGEAAMS